MAETVFHGICSNCVHARICRYALNAARPVQFCDHYEVGGKPAPETPAAPPPRRNRPGGGDDGRFKGLCVDCSKRHECDRAGTESGVWHCRDYEGPPDEHR
jgi:hypothetical protein